MNIVIFGASGRVGSSLVEYSLEKNLSITACSRNLEGLEKWKDRVSLQSVDVKDLDSVAKLIRNDSIVYSCLSGRSSKPDYSVLSIGIQNMIQAMEKVGSKRIILVAGAGILLDKEFGLRRDRPNYPEIFRKVSAENLIVLEKLQSSHLDWSMLCCPEMPLGERTEKYRMEIDYLPEKGNRISVQDVADAMLKITENEIYFQKRIGISY
jgi:putative NADH-flavin reductase